MSLMDLGFRTVTYIDGPLKGRVDAWDSWRICHEKPQNPDYRIALRGDSPERTPFESHVYRVHVQYMRWHTTVSVPVHVDAPHVAYDASDADWLRYCDQLADVHCCVTAGAFIASCGIEDVEKYGEFNPSHFEVTISIPRGYRVADWITPAEVQQRKQRAVEMTPWWEKSPQNAMARCAKKMAVRVQEEFERRVLYGS